ncbi:putative membrane protein; putative signal peptide [Frankia alni ACN14a]|uniref:Membrane protein putative signal peptide n=1 Tax=Frankia alni (strain DSM 45986 / CECT 9034 / ACN14a) TaxID=326424 RepID=Q0RNQ4_FRAAA|nr:putative membrane protein; putative signal peptide [Frankia alni ACN14a]
MRSTDPRTYLLRRVRRSAVVFLLGLAVLVVGVVLNQVPLTVILGILGFLMMLFAALRGAADLRRISGRDTGGRRPGGRGRSKGRSRTKAHFMERVEERWRRRWEDRP